MPLYVTTVGTSLLTNMNWRTDQELPEYELGLRALKEDPVRASAESNTLRALGLWDRPESCRVILVLSDTPAARWIQKVLTKSLKAMGCRPEARTIPFLGSPASKEFSRGIRTFIRTMFALLRQHPDADIVASGGYKAQMAYTNLIGMLLKRRVHYLNELHQEPMALEPLPIRWDVEVLADARPFLEAAEEPPGVPVREGKSWLAGRDVLRALVAEDEGVYLLSTTGQFALEALRERDPVPWPPPSSQRLAEDKNGLSGVSHHRPTGWQAVIKRLCSVEWVERITYHDGAHASSSRVLVYGDDQLVVTYVSKGNCLNLLVEVTASGSQMSRAQEELSGLLGWT